jgi:hypothetical protein
VEVDVSRLRVERVLDYGAYWLGLQLLNTRARCSVTSTGKLGLVEFLDSLIAPGREDVPWSMMAMVLVLMRLVQPSSELKIAEDWSP